MVSTFTPNINLEEPARGDDVGTWDTPVNNNMTLLDLTVGANTAISVGSGNVTLSTPQYRSRVLTFNSTLIQNTTITFPSTFTKDYKVLHSAFGSSAFTITLATTVSGGQVVGIPPGQAVDVYNDGTNIKFIGGLPPVGSYLDLAVTAVPSWISASTVPPFINCDGTTFSSATYPQLAIVLGGTTLPDGRGRYRGALNQGTGRITSGTGGVDGNTILASGGIQAATLSSLNVPLVPDTHQHAVTAQSIVDQGQFYQGGGGLGGVASIGTGSGSDNFTTPVATIGHIGNVSPTAFAILPPTYIGGLTMIRGA